MIRKLIERGIVKTVKSAKKIIDDRHKPFLDAQRVNYRTDSGEPAQPEAKMIRE